MSNHPSRHPGAAMRRESYLKLAREMRESADRIEQIVGDGMPQDPREKQALTRVMSAVSRNARRAARRHHGFDVSCPECGELHEHE